MGLLLLMFLIALFPASALAQPAKESCPPSPPVVYRCHYERIQPGMSDSEVRAIVGYDGVEESASASARIVRWVDTPPYGPGIISIVFVRGKSGWVVSTKSGHDLRRRPTDAEREAERRRRAQHDAEIKAIKECGDVAVAAIKEGRGVGALKMRDDCMTERGFPR